MVSLNSMTVSDFLRFKNTNFSASVDGGEVPLTLVEASGIGQGTREGGAFALLWQGPQTPMLPQATYLVSHESLGAHEMFLVPVAQSDSGFQYEAVFT